MVIESTLVGQMCRQMVGRREKATVVIFSIQLMPDRIGRLHEMQAVASAAASCAVDATHWETVG